MNTLTINNLLEVVKNYNPEEEDIIKKAYDYAENLHSSQKRQSGEPYIIHPLNVAYILAEMHAEYVLDYFMILSKIHILIKKIYHMTLILKLLP